MNDKPRSPLTEPRLVIGRYRARFTAAHPVRFGDFPGSAWRGALGHALKRAVCLTRQADCRACSLYYSCLFPYFFDTPPPPGAIKMRRYATAPHPFVLSPGEDGAARYSLEFTLIGQANRHLAVFVHALEHAARGGQGVAGQHLQLAALEQEPPPLGSGQWQGIYSPGGRLEPIPLVAAAIPPVPSACQLIVHTPLRVKRDGRHVGPGDFRFADLFGHLLRRVSMLTAFHTDTPLETDFRGLMALAREVPARTELVWEDKTRYSHRQQAAMKLGGVVGRIELSGNDLTPFWPYLWLGQWLHAGSGATMGLGCYRIEPASLPAQPVRKD